jgi:hypothetical protein
VQHLARHDGAWSVRGAIAGAREPFAIGARFVAVACGPIATARLILDALHLEDVPVEFRSCPTAAFAVVDPGLIGSALPDRVFASAQLSFVTSVEDLQGDVFGNIFSAGCLPVAEFVARSPLPARTSAVVFKALVPAMLVGNVFMPGHLSDHRLVLRRDGVTEVTWGYKPALDDRLAGRIRHKIARAMRRCGVFLVPGGFKPSVAGSDMHYAATVPMCVCPEPHQATCEGEVKGLPGVFVVDGAALPSLPAKAHTLTIMANADRIGGIVESRLAASED